MKLIRAIALLVVVAAAFAGGYVFRAVKEGGTHSTSKGERKVLYWVDPMHPAYKSDKPGIAPDCGMQLEPVYADNAEPSSAPVKPIGADDISAMPVGTVQITPEKQQVIGVKY